MTADELGERLLVALSRRYVQSFDWRACRLGSRVHVIYLYTLALNLSVGDDDWRPATAMN